MSDDKLKAAYSALPREEPRAAIDDAILAASRRAVARPPASRRWAGPVSIAAVLVLAFGVTLRMQEEKLESPDVYVAPPVTQAPARAVEPKPSEPVAAAPSKKVAPQAGPERDRGLRDEARVQPEAERKDLRPKLQAAPAEETLSKESNVQQAPMPAAPAAPPAPAAAAAAPAARMKREAFSAAAPAGIAADAQVAGDEPARELEAIAKLRAEGRHEEADKALEEFRRKRPGYRIPEAMWERVKPR